MATRKNDAPSLLPCLLSLFPSSSSSSSIVRALVLLLALSHFLMTSAGDTLTTLGDADATVTTLSDVNATVTHLSDVNATVTHLTDLNATVTHFGDTNVCDSFPCGPVGFCLLGQGGKKHGYTCACDQGFHQTDPMGPCEDTDECAGSDNPCDPGTCTNSLGDYFCDCPSQYVESIDNGVRKCIKDSHACKGRPCGPAGSCIPMSGGSYSCDCVPGFAPAVGTPGPCLEIDDPCTGNPCGKGGRCESVLGGGYHCCCNPGYKLPERFARFGGKCVKVKVGNK